MSSNSTSSINNAATASTATFVTALVFNIAVFGIELGIFTVVWTYFPAIYQPRTYAVSEDRRVPAFARNPLLWPLSIFRADFHDIKHANGMDAYFFVRFLLMMCRILLPIWLISWIVLLPVDSVNTSVGDSGLDIFIFGNIAPDKQGRYAAHLLCAWIFTVWISYTVRGEMKHFVETRQRWLIDPENASAKSNTVLITGVPRRYLTEAALFQLFSHLPGGVQKVWLNRDLKEMPDLHDRRVKACARLESAETKLLATAQKLYNKRLKKEAKLRKKTDGGKSAELSSLDADGRPLTASSTIDIERGDVSLVEKLVPQKKRPTHRLPIFSFLPSLPLIGKEVDSIEWAREEISETSAALRRSRRVLAKDVASSSSLTFNSVSSSSLNSPSSRANHSSRGVNEDSNANANMGEGDISTGESHPDSFRPGQPSQTYPPLNSAFVLFNTQIGAHLAAQTLTHHEPYRMADKSIGVAPQDVIWGNLNMNPYDMRVRTAIAWGLTFGLIIVWAIPVAFIGAVSNIHSLCSTYKWLAWICNLPPVVVGVISGILPPALLAILMMFLPIILRLLARFQGVPQRTRIELSLMDRYFLFQVIHSFLIVTLSSGIITSLPLLLKNPSNIPSLLANSLPKASNFFLTFVILQGLTGSASGFLQVIPLILYYVKLFVFASTPRSIYKIKYTLRSVSWGTLFPGITLISVITIAYSIISPIINGLSCLSFVLFYYLWKYLFLWQLEQPRSQETGGLFFPKAINHVFVGLYLQQICLAALFFLAENESGHPSAIPEGALMIVLIAFTGFFHLIITNSYSPLKHYLPITLADSGFGSHDNNRAAAEGKLKNEESMKEKESDRRGQEPSVVNNDEEIDEETIEEINEKGAIRMRDYASPVTTTSVNNVDLERGQVPSGMPDDDDELGPGIDEEEGPKDFYHPATVDPQPVIWIPKDILGLAEAEEEVTRQLGIAVAIDHAIMDGKAHVDIDGPPPDEKTI